jgi:hypothetical protein
MLSACSTIPRYGARQVGEAYDELLEYSEFMLCQGASVGAIQRRYRTATEHGTWLRFCAIAAQRDNAIAGERMKAAPR